ncbi:MAG: DDE-type integrase/transposase/recombinase [Planctomycetaceae bacterium]|nr:DDE-type integrase/transposase/recombinase [Planctomycetaceae bacterium]
MKNIYHRLLLLIAGSTQKELASQIRYLKIENRILRSKLPTRVQVTAQERNKLVKFGSKLGKALNELVTIVHPSTLRRWIRESKKATTRKPPKKGRPRTNEEIRELIIKLARENDWGYTRIMGELKKLNIKPPSRNTVKNILKENGLEPGPKRGAGTWDEFLKIHAATLWQCDFYSKKVLTIKGFRDLFLLVFLHVESRRVFIAPSTFHPNEAWVKEQAHAFLTHVSDSELGATVVMHDRDTKLTTSFDACLESTGIDVKKAAPRSPNTNAFVERFIQTLQQEVLDYFIVFGEQHMDHIVSEALAYYHEERPHQAKENVPLAPAKPSKSRKTGKRKKDQSPPDAVPVSQIECRQRLGGLLKHYSRKAA